MASANSRYSGVAITLHWVMAALILFMIWLGHNMENHEARFQLHKSIGITILRPDADDPAGRLDHGLCLTFCRTNGFV